MSITGIAAWLHTQLLQRSDEWMISSNALYSQLFLDGFTIDEFNALKKSGLFKFYSISQGYQIYINKEAWINYNPPQEMDYLIERYGPFADEAAIQLYLKDHPELQIGLIAVDRVLIETWNTTFVEDSQTREDSEFLYHVKAAPSLQAAEDRLTAMISAFDEEAMKNAW